MPPSLQISKLVIVGVGLIGGSVGLAAKKRQLAQTVVGVGRNKDRLALAENLGAIDAAMCDLAEAAADAEFVLVATPVDTIAPFVRKAVGAAPATAVVTDAGSTKAAICHDLRDLPFVGSHPLAGDHRAGCEFAREDLLDGKTVVITPTGTSPAEHLERTKGFWRALGAEIHMMDPATHDRAVAAISHLPHLLASALVAATPEEYLSLAASGWKDTTRIAAADPGLWRSILAQNRSAVMDSIDQIQEQLRDLRQMLAAEDLEELEAFLQDAQRIRHVVGS